MFEVLAILVGLLAVFQFLIKTDRWSLASKIVTCLLLAIISILLFLCKEFNNNSITSSVDDESSQALSTTLANNLTSTPTEVPMLAEAPAPTAYSTKTAETTPMETPALTATPALAKALDCRLCDANIVDRENVTVTDQRYVNDSFGNSYRQEVVFDYIHNSGYVIFSTLGNYTGFKGTIAIYQYTVSGTKKHDIEIFMDDTSIYYITMGSLLK